MIELTSNSSEKTTTLPKSQQRLLIIDKCIHLPSSDIFLAEFIFFVTMLQSSRIFHCIFWMLPYNFSHLLFAVLPNFYFTLINIHLCTIYLKFWIKFQTQLSGVCNKVRFDVWYLTGRFRCICVNCQKWGKAGQTFLESFIFSSFRHKPYAFLDKFYLFSII